MANTGTTFFVTGNSGLNSWSSPTGLVDYEWLCIQDEFCSYQPSEYKDFSTISLPTLNEFRTRGGKTNQVVSYVIEDGASAYGDPVCPTSRCPAVILAVSGTLSSDVQCPIGTQMVFTIRTAEGYTPTFTLGSDAMFLSASSNCPVVGTSISCTGTTATINVTSVVTPCTTLPCDFPTTGFAYGSCGALETCANGLETTEGGIGKPNPTTEELLNEVLSNQTSILASLERIEDWSNQTGILASLERIEVLSNQTGILASLERIELMLQDRRGLPDTESDSMNTISPSSSGTNVLSAGTGTGTAMNIVSPSSSGTTNRMTTGSSSTVWAIFLLLWLIKH